MKHVWWVLGIGVVLSAFGCTRTGSNEQKQELTASVAQRVTSGPCTFSAPPTGGTVTNVTFTVKTPSGVQPSALALGSDLGSLTVENGAHLVVDSGGFAAIASVEASARLAVGTDVQAQSAYSELTGINLGDRTHLHGVAKSASPVTCSTGTCTGTIVTVDGGISQNTSLKPLGVLSWNVAFPSLNRGNCIIQPDNTETIDPGTYGDITVNARSHLKLRAGTYYFTSLTIQPTAFLDFDNAAGPVFLDVKNAFAWNGSVTATQPTKGNIVFALATNQAVNLLTAIRGIVVAPSSTLTLASDGSSGHVGSFFAKTLDLKANAIVHQQPLSSAAVCPGATDCSALCPCASGGLCQSDSECQTGLSCQTPAGGGAKVCAPTDKCNPPGGPPVVCTALDQCHSVGTCDSSTGLCSNPVKANGTSCSDGNACTASDTCQSGSCTPGSPVAVDDGNPCTTDACNPSSGVSHTPVAAGTSCTDGNACNGAETCSASAVCVAGTPPVVDDGNPCTTDSCAPSTGVSHTPVAAGTSCSDGNACNGAELCNATGVCNAGTPVVCVASDQCHNAGTCSPSTGTCSNPAKTNGSTCTDGNACTQTDTCQAGTCTAGAQVAVDDGNPCTADACNPATGVSHTPVAAGTSCSDGNACNGAETCNASATCTAGTPPVVDDGNPCTTDACNASTGVTHTPVAAGTSCSDGNACNGAETCNASAACTAGTPPVVDDGNPCTTDACSASTGVSHTPVAAGTSCSDGNACNGAETCNATGTCTPGTPVTCVASDQCHVAGTCDSATGACSNPAKTDGSACTDGNACTQSDTCQAGTCTSGTQVTVDDGNPCTADACDAATGVSHTPVAAGTACSDGNACNGAETCSATGACTSGTPPTVDDGNPCTTDACDAATGVTHTPVGAGTSCSDGNACNGAETCDASGICTPGTPLSVDDGNPCTADTCSPSGGVTHTPVSNGTSCADANVCNGAETCQSGTCTAGTPVSIDDNNPCTDDSCDAATGVTHSPRAAGSSCSDFDLCNGNEMCDASGTCQPGTPVAIDTSNACNLGTCDPATGIVTYAPRAKGSSCLVDACNNGTCNGSGECTASGSTVTDAGNPCTLEWCDPVRGPQQTTCSTLDRTVGTTLNSSLKWLYSGANPIQQGVASGTIQTEQAVALRGRVTTRDGGPLSGVTVAILSHPEFGHTLTQSNGYFDMVVNGGGTLIVDYQRTGYLRVQRPISSQWNDYASLPDIVMIPPDPVVTTLDTTGGSGDMQVAQATVQTDQSGTRQGVLLVPAGTQASMHLPNGTEQALDSMNVRITEYTVGPDGDKAMPASLPGASKYTYAFDVNADEAVAANATSITFDTPLVYYSDNFLLFPAGTTVPLGFFDATASQWKASDSGVVVEVVGVSGGRAELDVTGDHVADPPSQLATFGITDTELQKMAEVYAPGRTLWRVQLPHFTPWDENWGGGPPPDATGPNAQTAFSDPTPTCQTPQPGNSIIECESQVLRETVPIAGTPYTLNYSSERAPGRIASNRLTIPLSGASIPQSLLHIDLDVTIAGVAHHQSFPASANLTTTFDWDGLDAFHRQPQGAQIATVKIGYAYQYTYSQTDRFGYNGNGLTLSVQVATVPPPPGGFPSLCLGLCEGLSARTRQEISISQSYSVPIGGLDARALGLGGWTLDVQHFDELLPQRLELGTGERMESNVLPPSFDPPALSSGDSGDFPAFTVGPDKTLYFASGVGQIFKATPGQAPVLFAGNGTTTYNGDNLPATSAGFAVNDLALGRDGTLYFADGKNDIVRAIGADGLVKTVGGVAGARGVQDIPCPPPDPPPPPPMLPPKNMNLCSNGCPLGATCSFLVAGGGGATQTPMSNPHNLAVSSDGNIYVSTDSNIMRITTDDKLGCYAGLIQTPVTGSALALPVGTAAGCYGDGPYKGYEDDTVHSYISKFRISPQGLAVAPDGTLYAILSGFSPDGSIGNITGTVIVKFVDGVMQRVAGDGCVAGCAPAWRDGAAALTGHMQPTGLAFDTNGKLYVSDTATENTSGGFTRVATLTADGLLEATAGIPAMNGGPAVTNGLPAKSAQLQGLPTRFIAVGPNGLYLRSGGAGAQVRRIGVPLPHDTGTSSVVGSRDSDSYFVFDEVGRHLATKNSLTGADLVGFGYDANGHVVTITDASGNVTTVNRDAAGNPVAFVAPFGQQTNVALDANGYLQSVTDPEGNSYGMGYQNGLLTSFTNARGITSTMQYDAEGRLHVDSDSIGGSQTLSRTDSGSDWTVDRTTALGHVTSYETEVHEDGHQIRRVVPPDNTQSTTTSGADRTTQIVAGDGTITSATERPDARLGLASPIVNRTTVLPSGMTSTATTTRTYASLDPSNILNFNARTDVTNVNGHVWSTTYTPSTETFQTFTPANRTFTRTTDSLGRPVVTQLDGLAPISFFYDSNGRLDHTTQGDGSLARIVAYGYVPSGSSKGYLRSATDPLLDSTTYTRDALGRVLTETRAGASTSFAWDGEDELTSVTPPGKPSHGMTYTPVNLLATYSPPSAGLSNATTSYTYDADRMLRTETRPDAVQIVRTPDSAGRLGTVQILGGMLQYNYYAAGTPSGAGRTSDVLGPYGVNLHFTYDGALTTNMTFSGDVNGSVGWTYNSDFNKTSETVNGASGSAQVIFGYDGDQLLTCASPTNCDSPGADALSLGRNGAGLVSNIALGNTREIPTYNTFGELARQTASYSGSSLVDITYDAPGFERDKLGRITQKTEVIGGTTNGYRYTYDHLRRLTDVTLNGAPSEHFEYDTNGNRTLGVNSAAGTSYTGTYDDQDRLLSYGPFDFTYTANGELETKTNRETGQEWIFAYDALGNLLSVGLPNGDLVEYLVDGLGRRVGKKKNGVLQKQWLYRNALKPVAELDASGSLVSEFVYGAKNNVPDYVLRGGATYRVISDQLGSPRYVVNAANATDVPFSATYTSFGEVTGTGLDWMPFGFAGGIYDADTGVIRFGKRDYDPAIGRWISKEPLRFRAARNFYVYAWNDPINLFDPTGLAPTGVGGASGNGEGGGEGVGNDPIQSNDPWIPPQDWCGSKGSEWVPDNLGNVDISDACKTHDECYDTCGSNKFLCDYGLQQDISMDCATQGGGMGCQMGAGIYFDGVQSRFGDDAFNSAQSDCTCH